MVRHASFASLAAVCLGAFVALGGCSSLPSLQFDDGGRPVDPNCVKMGPEICDDGIDNDCNGDVDCQDPACTPAFGCQDVPEGWTAVGFAAATRPDCPSFEVATDLNVVGGDGSAGCTCSCVAGGSCAGDFALTLTTENTCSVTPTTATIPPGTAACTALKAPINVLAGAFAKIAAATCSPKVIPSGGLLQSGRLCQAPRFGGGCGPNQVCAPTPSAGLDRCVTKTGANACPAGFGTRTTGGASATDGRTCTGCVCAPPAPCTGGSVSVYDGSMCKTAGAAKGAVGITQACAATSDANFTATHFTSTPSTGGGCASTPTTQAAPGGALTFTDQRTICCK